MPGTQTEGHLMRTRLIVLALVLAASMAAAITIAATAGGAAAAVDPTPQQQIVQLKKQIRAKNARIADLQDERDALNLVLEDKDDQITRLQSRIANQPDPLDVIIAREPDGLWSAMLAIWRAFPTIPAGELCGYDRSSSSGDAVPFTVTTYTFSRWTGC